ncbi:MAG: hypothetical protein JW940_02650 [Polyangiaceae bacterium]|nr:hypothetical protein [Polyangiaceae bacterium]
MTDDVLGKFGFFAAAVRDRLEKGREVYGDASFTAAPDALLDEIAEELQDVCAWSYILWTRLERLRCSLPRDAATSAPRGRMVGAERGQP